MPQVPPVLVKSNSSFSSLSGTSAPLTGKGKYKYRFGLTGSPRLLHQFPALTSGDRTGAAGRNTEPIKVYLANWGKGFTNKGGWGPSTNDARPVRTAMRSEDGR